MWTLTKKEKKKKEKNNVVLFLSDNLSFLFAVTQVVLILRDRFVTLLSDDLI